MTGFHVRATTEHDWERVRDLRLEMIRDTPLAFGETLETALAHSENEWRMRGARGRSDRGIYLVAIDDDTDRWVGTMGGFLDGTVPLLVGVYVSPDRRGSEHGVAEALIASVEEWAQHFGPVITLHVHEENLRARAFYARLGYRPTGRRFPYVLDRSKIEFELSKRL